MVPKGNGRKCCIPLDEASIPQTAFTSPFGKYEYLNVPFGLVQAPMYFQELMNKVLKDLPFTIAYLDDIIYSRSPGEHLYHVQQVFHKLSMKLRKCHFLTKEIQNLGYILSKTDVKPLPSKEAAMKMMQLPKNAKQVTAFLGLVGHYCKFIKNFAEIAKPLTVHTHHDAKFDWKLGHHATFSILTSTLIEAPIFHLILQNAT